MSLTDEDKRWFNAQFERVESRIERVEARFESIEARIERIEARFESIEARIDRIEARIERVEVNVERVETSLLTEFHKWASPIEMRVRSHAAVLRAMDAEVELLGDRLKKLEGDRPV